MHELLLIDVLVVLVDEPSFVRNEHSDKSDESMSRTILTCWIFAHPCIFPPIFPDV
jgi:hypothetical protein